MVFRLLLALLLSVALVACSGASAADCDERIGGVRPGVCIAPPEERPAAPSVAMPVVGEDHELALEDYRGEVIVLNFWASWCGPCRSEQPALNEAHEELSDQPVAFLGVNLQDTEPNAQAHEREFDMPYPSLFDPANVYAAKFDGVGPRSIPSTIIIDKQGRVAARLFGEILGPQEVIALAERLAFEGG
ncbi:MAG: TlpA disulfide reductase family protein [Nitriliruptorales bacterium]|nr:TlpA disulfide reductase family protein [Nitriliruptorales bacterium]